MPNVFKFRTRKPKKHINAADQTSAPLDGIPGESPHLNLTILPSRASPDALKEPCDDHRALVGEFLAESFYGKKDVICEVRYCTICTWVASNGVNIDCCPVCGQAVRTINFVVEREVLASFKDAVVEITLKK